MALTSLTNLKLELGISGTSEDTKLAKWIREASSLIRFTADRYLIGVISANTAVASTVITSYGHGLETGAVISIADSNSTPTINGERTITRIDNDTFSIPVTVTGAGTAGTFTVRLTEFYAGHDSPQLVLRQTPVQSIVSVYEDSGAFYGEASGAFASDTLLTAGTDYCLLRDKGNISTSGIVLRTGGYWPAAGQTLKGLLAAGTTPGLGNIKVTYFSGYTIMPYDLELCCQKIVAELRAKAGTAGDKSSESLDYYSYSKASTSEQNNMLGSAANLLRRWRKVVI